MRKTFVSLVCFLFALVSVPAVFSAPSTGREVMELVDGKKDPKDGRQTLSMTLVDKKGKSRVRQVVSYSRKAGDVDQSVMVFLAPADVKNVGFLSHDYKKAGRADDKWLYLPALKSVRKITGSGGNDYFMGTDFTYDDMGGRDLDDYDYKLLREEAEGGIPCWVVETVPKDKDYGYSRMVQWVRQDALIACKVDFYDRQGGLLKRMTVGKAEEVGGYWTVLQMEMANLQNGHKTLLEISKVEYDTGIPESTFRVSTLERGMLK